MSDISLDLKEQIARIDRMQEETRKFAEEQHKLLAENRKLSAEALKMSRERDLAPWQLIFTGMAAAAAMIGTTAAFIKIFG